MSEQATATPSEDLIVVNGIDGTTGQYLVKPMTLAQATAQARGRRPPTDHEKPLAETNARVTEERKFGLPIGKDENTLKDVGWGVVFTPGTTAAVRQALKPLLDRRQAETPANLYKELDYQPNETCETWLRRHNVSGANVIPTRVPYFLMLVGGPEEIPFELQYLLDLNYAVGRVAFDQAEDYGRYAEAVVAYETAAKVDNTRDVVFWGTAHAGDRATQLSSSSLIQPLFEGIPAVPASPGNPGEDAVPPMAETFGFRSRCLRGPGQATKANLLEVLHSRQKAPPSLLFTASHGMGWPKGDAQQRPASGALLCQDWPGFGGVKPQHYLTAAEVEAGARLRGVVAFLFACYGAGTPRFDPFLQDPAGGPVEVAEAPFVSALGQRLLSRGALAVVGHVERAWTCSIKPRGVGPQLQPFSNFIGRVMGGERVGNGPLDFSERYATFSVAMLNRLDPSLPAAKLPADPDLVSAWIERNDAQNYVVLGDPAVRLRIDDLK
jgi:hypothetical protein